MKYQDRKKIGIELFLASKSPLFSRASDLSPDSAIARLKEQSFRVRFEVARLIRESVRELLSEDSDVSELVPKQVAVLATDICSPDRIHRMRPFFRWIEKLQVENERARTECSLELNSFASALNRESAEYIRTFCSSRTQVTMFMLERNESGGFDALLSHGERDCGRMTVRFPDCKPENEADFPLFGYIFLFEPELLPDGRCRIHTLVDLSFKNEEYPLRTIKRGLWRELTFESELAQASFEPVDYTSVYALRGTPRLDLVTRCGKILYDKSVLLGSAFLSRGETDALPLAVLLALSDTVAQRLEQDKKEKKGSSTIEAAFFETIQNRFALDSLSELMKRNDAPQLAALLERVCELSENEQLSTAIDEAARFCRALREQVSSGKGRKLMCAMEEMLSAASKTDMPLPLSRETELQRVCAGTAELVTPLLRAEGFTGEYPDYRRMRRGRAEFITFTVCDHGFNDEGGLRFGVGAEVSQLRLTREERRSGLVRGISFELSRATDSTHEAASVSRSGSPVCTLKDGISCATVKTAEDCRVQLEEKELRALIKTALRALKGRRLTHAERKCSARLRKESGTKPFRRRFMRLLPKCTLMCVLVLAVYASLYYLVPSVREIDMRLVAIPAALAGVLTDVVLSVVYCWRRRARLWRY